MAIGTENYPNTAATTADYPHGGIKDDTGAGDGVPVNKLVYDDLHQTFRKWLDMAGITPNNTPDNVTNGYQYVSALDYLYKKFTGVLVVTSNTVLTNADKNKLISVTGAGADVLLTLPNPSTCQEGDTFTVFNNDEFNVEIRRPTGGGGGAINVGGSTITSIFIPGKYSFVELVLDKANLLWYPSQYQDKGIFEVAQLINGWAVYAGRTPYYKKSGEQVVFKGAVTIATGTASPFFIAYPPTVTREIPCVTAVGSSYIANLLVVDTSGEVSLKIPTGSSVFVFLDGLSYFI